MLCRTSFTSVHACHQYHRNCVYKYIRTGFCASLILTSKIVSQQDRIRSIVPVQLRKETKLKPVFPFRTCMHVYLYRKREAAWIYRSGAVA